MWSLFPQVILFLLMSQGALDYQVMHGVKSEKVKTMLQYISRVPLHNITPVNKEG